MKSVLFWFHEFISSRLLIETGRHEHTTLLTIIVEYDDVYPSRAAAAAASAAKINSVNVNGEIEQDQPDGKDDSKDRILGMAPVKSKMKNMVEVQAKR